MNDDLTDLYQEVILEHAKSPGEQRELKNLVCRIAGELLGLRLAR